MAHCHEMGVMHRNIKPENILIDDENDENIDVLSDPKSNLKVYLADFAHSRTI